MNTQPHPHSHKEPAQSLPKAKQRYSRFFPPSPFWTSLKRNQSFVKGKLKIPPAHPSVPSLQPNPFYCLLKNENEKPRQQQNPTHSAQNTPQTANLNARGDSQLGVGGEQVRSRQQGKGERCKVISKSQHLRADAPPKNGGGQDRYST